MRGGFEILSLTITSYHLSPDIKVNVRNHLKNISVILPLSLVFLLLLLLVVLLLVVVVVVTQL